MPTSTRNADSSSGPPASDTSDWYLSPEKLAVVRTPEQEFAIRTLCSSLVELARRRGWASDEVFIGSRQFFAWLESDPLLRLTPDAEIIYFALRGSPLPRPP